MHDDISSIDVISDGAGFKNGAFDPEDVFVFWVLVLDARPVLTSSYLLTATTRACSCTSLAAKWLPRYPLPPRISIVLPARVIKNYKF